MAEAPVGDDVYGEDPSVNALQEKSAELMGKEAALFVPTGTMANQVALKVHTRPAEEVILSDASHLYTAESGAAAVISGVMLSLRPAPRGILDPADVEAAIRPSNIHAPRTSLVWIENTHNFGGGSVYPLATLKAISDVAKRRGLALHMDGARIFNAAIAARISAKEFAKHCDTVNFCLSKGLGCPVGSVISGSRAFIAEALRWRKMLGGGMRQAGILAAAGLYALEHNIDRLAEDHANARLLAERLASHPLVKLDPATVESNIVMPFFDQRVSSAKFIDAAFAAGVRCIPRGPHGVRLVTHLDVSRSDVERAAEILLGVLDGL
jgi:threonine aldolase